MRPDSPCKSPVQSRSVEQRLCSLCVLRCCADPCSLLLQFDIQSTTSSTLARMSEITIELERDECTVRSVADEPRCEFPVVPDRLVGELPSLPVLPDMSLGPCCCCCCCCLLLLLQLSQAVTKVSCHRCARSLCTTDSSCSMMNHLQCSDCQLAMRTCRAQDAVHICCGVRQGGRPSWTGGWPGQIRSGQPRQASCGHAALWQRAHRWRGGVRAQQHKRG